MSRIIALGVCGFASLIALRAQELPGVQAPAFRSRVDLLRFDVSVLDNARRPVRGLTTTDFVVRVDGRVVRVEAFTPVEIPAAVPPLAAWMREVAPDVASNTVSDEGRAIVILFDRTIAPADTPAARRIARAAVEAMRPVDLGAVVYVAKGVPQGFTSDRALLVKTIDQPFAGLPDEDAGNPSECFCDTCTLDTISQIAEVLRGVPQRQKTLLFIGSRVSFEDAPSALGSCFIPKKDARERLFRALGRTNLTVHSLDPSGLRTLQPGASAGGVPLVSRTAINTAEMSRVGNLGILPSRTGGRRVASTNNPDLSVPGILRESEAYYVIGIEPPAPRADGRDHVIDIRARRGGLRVSAQRAYVSEAATAPAVTEVSRAGVTPLSEALSTLWPKRDLSLSVVVAPFAVPGSDKAAVAVVLSGSRTSGAAAAASSISRSAIASVSVLAGAFDRNGRSLTTQAQTIDLPDAPAGEGRGSYEVLSRLSVTRGRYEIRVALEDSTAGARGSVYTYVEVPDFAHARLSLSGVALGYLPPMVASQATPFADLMPFVPTAVRRFPRTGQLMAFVRAYQGRETSATGVEVISRVIDEREAMVFSRSVVLPGKQFNADRSAGYQVDLPVSTFVPGAYLLTIQAKAADAVSSRQVRFTLY